VLPKIARKSAKKRHAFYSLKNSPEPTNHLFSKENFRQSPAMIKHIPVTIKGASKRIS